MFTGVVASFFLVHVMFLPVKLWGLWEQTEPRSLRDTPDTEQQGAAAPRNQVTPPWLSCGSLRLGGVSWDKSERWPPPQQAPASKSYPWAVKAKDRKFPWDVPDHEMEHLRVIEKSPLKMRLNSCRTFLPRGRETDAFFSCS